MGILDRIKQDAKKVGSNKSKIFYLKEGGKARIRFLADMEEGTIVKFHDSFEKGINVPCQEIFGRECEYCDDDSLRTRDLYAWPVYDYESKEIKIFLYAVNNCSPLPALMALYETYGTLTDRDYVLTVTGRQQNKTFSVVPMDKNKFRNSKVKALSEEKILKIIDKAFPATNDEDDDDEEEEEIPKKSKKSKVQHQKNKKPQNESVEDDDDYWEDEDDDEKDYENMTPKELYKLCKEYDIEAAPKKTQKYYINLLNEYDKANEDWGDDDDDDWEEE